MSRILFVFERDMPTISIQRDIFGHLHDKRIQSSFIYLVDVKPKDIDAHDIIVFMRPNDSYSWKVAYQAKKAGHTVVTFCDDDLLNLPKSVPTMPWRKKGLCKILALSDVIWSSSRSIVEKYLQLSAGKRFVISDTIIQPDELEELEKIPHHGKVKIVYAAAPSHAELFEKYISPVISLLAKKYDFQLTFVSVHPAVTGISCEYVSGMPLAEYRRYMREQHFDIGLAPLHNDEFSKCKYFNKFLEYTMQGIVGIYSNTEPYTYVVKNGENGFLAENDPQSWLDVISKAIEDRKLRENCLENAVAYIKTNHSEEACLQRMAQGLPELFEERGTYNACGGFSAYRFLYYLMRPLDWLYLTLFYLKNTGIKGVMKRAKVHLTEAKAYSRRY